MLDGGVIERMEGTVTGVARSAPEGVWVPGGGIEVPCEYVYTVRCEKRPRRRKEDSPRSTEIKKTKKRRLKLPMAYCLLLMYCSIATLNNTRFVLPHKYMNPMNIATISATNFE